jgi:hypothetical protein
MTTISPLHFVACAYWGEDRLRICNGARIGSSRSLGSVHHDHQDRSIVITEIGIVITRFGPS